MSIIPTSRSQKSGQTLIEALIATVAVIMMVTGLIAGTISAMKAAQNARRRSIATKLTQEAMELIRSRRDDNWNNFVSLCPESGVSRIYCVDDSLDPLNRYYDLAPSELCDGNITVSDGSADFIYTRTASFVHNADNSVDIFVEVLWSEGDLERTSNAQTTLTNWR